MPLLWTTTIGIIKFSNAAVHDSGNWTLNCQMPLSMTTEIPLLLFPHSSPPLSIVRFVFFFFSSLLLKTSLTKYHALNLDSSSTSLPVTFCFFTQVISHLPPQLSFVSFYFINNFVFLNCCESGVICYDSRVASLIS